MTGQHGDGEVKSNGGDAMETMIHRPVGPGNEPQTGEMSKRRQLPIDTSDHTYGCTYEYPPDDSDRDGAELCHNDSKQQTETFLHPVTGMFVYMKSERGGAPYVCEYCDYKTTVTLVFLDHMNCTTTTPTLTTASDPCVAVVPVSRDTLQP